MTVQTYVFVLCNKSLFQCSNEVLTSMYIATESVSLNSDSIRLREQSGLQSSSGMEPRLTLPVIKVEKANTITHATGF